MSSFLSKKSKIKLKILAWYQIIGGIMGLLITFWLLAHTEQINGLILIIFLIAFGLYGFSTYSGYMLFKYKYLFGLKLSVINQALQILGFAMFGYAFLYVSGMFLFTEMKIEDGFKLGLRYYFGSQWQISFASEDKPFFLGVNWVPIFFIYFISKLRETIEREKTIFDENQIAELMPPESNG
jgi:hypothetical protein